MINNLLENIPEYSVSEFNTIFEETIKTAFDLIKIRGEISGLNFHTSGHIYFKLKDEDSVIDVVCWKSNSKNLKIIPEDGLEIIATGKITSYAKTFSKYQLIVENIEIAGVGALLKLIEARKQRLKLSGFFAEDKKKPLPFIPRSIGIITSPTGSVLKDIIHRIKERFPRPIQLWPTPVQGKFAAMKIIEAINGFNNNLFPEPPDVIIIARGGGSVEDLMPFNDEEIAKSVFYSKIPIISAIGHETDTTIIDLVSDLRTSTPTAAAEKCVPVRKELLEKVYSVSNNLFQANRQIVLINREKLKSFKILLQEPSNIILVFKNKLDNLIQRKNFYIKEIINKFLIKLNRISFQIKNPIDRYENKNLTLMNLWTKINYSVIKKIEINKNQYDNLSRLLLSSSVEKTLKRGYAIIKKNSKIVNQKNFLKDQDIIDIYFYKNQIKAKITKT